MCYSNGRNHQEYLGGHLEFDENETYENYECRYIGIEKLKNILFENKQTTREINSSLDDTTLVYEDFLSR